MKEQLIENTKPEIQSSTNLKKMPLDYIQNGKVYFLFLLI